MSRRLWIAAAIAIAVGAWLLRPRETLDLASSNVKRTWQPVVLMPWVKYGYDFGGPSDPRVDDWFARLEQDGIKAVAWFLFADGRGSLAFDSSGSVRGIAPAFLADYHGVLRIAKAHRMQVIWVLTDFELGLPAQTSGSVHMFGHADLLEDPAKRASFIQNALNPILHDDSPQVAGWIVMNEPEHLLRSGYVTESAVRAFTREVAAAIKRYHPGQRVGLANSDIASMLALADLEVLDFLVFHHYSPSLPPPVAFIDLRRPIFIGEFNLNYPPGLDLDRFIRATRALGYAGAWPWSLRNRVDENGTQATETEPQFEGIGAYARSMREPKGPLDPWAKSQLQQVLLPEVKQRLSLLAGQPEHHRTEAQINIDWANRCREEIARASNAEDLQKQRDDLLTATQRVRMHSYLQRETTLELDWLRSFEHRLKYD